MKDFPKNFRLLNDSLKKILDALDEGVHIIDADGITVYYNKVMEEIEGLSANEVLGKNILDVFPSLQSNTSTLYKVLITGNPIKNQVQTYTNLHGRKITTINSSQPLFLNGEIVGAMEVSRDISLIKNLQDKIIDLQQTIYGNKNEQPAPTGATYQFTHLIGESPLLKKTIERARMAARTSSSILICGESGTGKEMFAQSIHNASPRRRNPFIAFNCAALPSSLMEGILFGTRKGSFTGAIDRPGLFEQASTGTILLDEINSMSLELQAKLLRVIQEQKIRRLGSTTERNIDVRIISTVNTNISDLLEKGCLRQDLFFRLGVVIINVPPLRERPKDIPLLVEHYIGKYNALFGLQVSGVTPRVLDLFMSYHWPGNIRELMNVIEGAMNLITTEKLIDLDHLPLYLFYSLQKSQRHQDDSAARTGTANAPAEEAAVHVQPGRDSPPPAAANAGNLSTAVENVEKTLIHQALAKHHGNLSRASLELGIKRQALQYKLQKYNINHRQYHTAGTTDPG